MHSQEQQRDDMVISWSPVVAKCPSTGNRGNKSGAPPRRHYGSQRTERRCSLPTQTDCQAVLRETEHGTQEYIGYAERKKQKWEKTWGEHCSGPFLTLVFIH